MKKLIASGAVIVYAISAIVFSMVLPSGEKATATDFGVMCINAVYPSASIEFADSRDNENVSEDDGSKAKEAVTDDEKEKSEPVVLGESNGMGWSDEQHSQSCRGDCKI